MLMFSHSRISTRLFIQAAFTALFAPTAAHGQGWLAVTMLVAAAAVGIALVVRTNPPNMRLLVVGFEAAALGVGLVGMSEGHYIPGTIVGVITLITVLTGQQQAVPAGPWAPPAPYAAAPGYAAPVQGYAPAASGFAPPPAGYAPPPPGGWAPPATGYAPPQVGWTAPTDNPYAPPANSPYAAPAQPVVPVQPVVPAQPVVPQQPVADAAPSVVAEPTPIPPVGDLPPVPRSMNILPGQ